MVLALHLIRCWELKKKPSMCTVCLSLGLCVDPISTFTPLGLLPDPDSLPTPLLTCQPSPSWSPVPDDAPEPQPCAVPYTDFCLACVGWAWARKLGAQVAFMGPDWVVCIQETLDQSGAAEIGMDGFWVLYVLQHPGVCCVVSLLRSPGLDTSGEASPRAWGAGQGKLRCKVTDVWPISTGLECIYLVWPKPQSPAGGAQGLWAAELCQGL